MPLRLSDLTLIMLDFFPIGRQAQKSTAGSTSNAFSFHFRYHEAKQTTNSTAKWHIFVRIRAPWIFYCRSVHVLCGFAYCKTIVGSGWWWVENFRRSRKGRRDKKGFEPNDIEIVDAALIELSSFLDHKCLLHRHKMMMAVRIIELNSKCYRKTFVQRRPNGAPFAARLIDFTHKTPRRERRK